MRRVIIFLLLGLILPVTVHAKTLSDLIKADMPTAYLLLPFFEVDATDPSGTTTLFAIRNVTNGELEVTIVYIDSFDTTLYSETIVLAARQTKSVNIRDVVSAQGLQPVNGFVRGSVVAFAVGPVQNPVLLGDFFQVDVGGNFATGDRMISLSDLCRVAETRFLDFGSGTDLRIFITEPQGDQQGVDPPSFTVSAIDENGGQSTPVPFYTNNTSFKLSAADFTALSFGTLVFDFTNSGGGVVFAEYSADGLFSVGVNSACLAFEPIAAPQAER